jgi:hypothetical protein
MEAQGNVKALKLRPVVANGFSSGDYSDMLAENQADFC